MAKFNVFFLFLLKLSSRQNPSIKNSDENDGNFQVVNSLVATSRLGSPQGSRESE